jgi:hypothetical protein
MASLSFEVRFSNGKTTSSVPVPHRHFEQTTAEKNLTFLRIKGTVEKQSKKMQKN